VESPPEAGEPIFIQAETVDLDIDACPIRFYAVLTGAETIDLGRVRMPAIA
jgi:hypothetical protein